MDPNANLKEQRLLAARIIQAVDEGFRVVEADAERLAELVIALDDWLHAGGFLPDPWRRS